MAACVLLLCYRNFILFSHYYTLDNPLTALTVLTVLLCVLLTKEDFQHKGLAWGLGLLLAVGIASKHLYLAFTGPCYLVLGVLWLKTANYNPISAIKKTCTPPWPSLREP